MHCPGLHTSSISAHCGTVLASLLLLLLNNGCRLPVVAFPQLTGGQADIPRFKMPGFAAPAGDKAQVGVRAPLDEGWGRRVMPAQAFPG